MNEIPADWERAPDIEKHHDEIGYQAFRSIRHPELVVTIEDDITQTNVTAKFASADIDQELLDDNCDNHHTACRRAREYMEAMTQMGEAYVQLYGLEVGDGK